MITYECKNAGCKHRGVVEIDPNATSMICDVVGIVNVKDVRVIHNVVNCSTCNSEIYKQ